MSEEGLQYHPESAAAAGLTGCHKCYHLRPLEEQSCRLCGTSLHARKEDSLNRTIAFTVASAVLYIPANLLPIMSVTQLGGQSNNTIIGGVITFWELQAYPVAIIIFIASVAIPLLKLVAIFLLVRAAKSPSPVPQRMVKIYRATEVVGRWSMVDVFVVAILVAMVQLGSLMSITPGPAALSFGGVVVLTMLAAHFYDPRLIWDRHFSSTPKRLAHDEN